MKDLKEKEQSLQEMKTKGIKDQFENQSIKHQIEDLQKKLINREKMRNSQPGEDLLL